jgi:hypothetical protein
VALDSVSDYVSDCRTLLQDMIAPYRYADADLVVAFNVTILEARRLRPDLFIYAADALPSFTAVDSTLFDMEYPFRLAFVYGICAHALARDQEDVQDSRSSSFMEVFNAMLLGTRTPAIGGGAKSGNAKSVNTMPPVPGS